MIENALLSNMPLFARHESNKFSTNWGSLLDFVDLSTSNNISALACSLPTKYHTQMCEQSLQPQNEKLKIHLKLKPRYGALSNALLNSPRKYNIKIKHKIIGLPHINNRHQKHFSESNKTYKDVAKNIMYFSLNKLTKIQVK